MLLETISNRLRLFRLVNATDNGFPSRVPRATKPSGAGDSAAQATSSAVLEVGPGVGQNSILIVPFGVGSDTNTFSLRLIGWSLATNGDPDLDIYVPTVLCELAVALTSGAPGLAGKLVSATNLFADTITVTRGNANVSLEAVNIGGDIIAHAVVDFKGFELIEMTTTTGGSATSCNALYKLQ